MKRDRDFVWFCLITGGFCLFVAIHFVQLARASQIQAELNSTRDVRTSHHRVVFNSNRNGDFSSAAFSINPDGTDETRLSRHKTGRPLMLDTRVSWDSTHIAFTRGGSDHHTGVWIMNSDGLGEEKIIDDVIVRFGGGWASPSLSPDNKEIVYVASRGGREDIYRISTEAKKPIRLTSEGERNRLPRWSPDGKWIAYASKRGQNRNIMLMRPDGSEPRAITTSDSDDTQASWLPDSSGLVFISDRDGQTDIYVINLASGDIYRMTNTKEFHELHPAMSPDGSMIAFEAKPLNSRVSWMRNIYVMPVDGGTALRLTTSDHRDSSPSWITTAR